MQVFFGTSPRSALLLEKAVKAGLKVDLVVSQPAKPIGKKQTLTENPTVSLAKKLSIPYLEKMEALFNLPSPKLGIILDFNKIVPQRIIDYFQKGIINVHFSKLPCYRGPAPVQYAILNGDKIAWISYYLISEKLDQGKILVQTALDLTLKETADELYLKLIDRSSSEIQKIARGFLNGKILPQPQVGIPTYTHKLTFQNCRIDWNKSSQEIERLIRAAYPEPGAWCEINLQAKKLKILKSHLEKEKLVLDEVQLEGKKPVSWNQFKQGYPKAKII